MLSAMLIGPDDSLLQDCREKLGNVTGLYVCHHSYQYPTPAELAAQIGEFNPDAIIISLSDYTQVLHTLGRLSVDRPQLPVIAVSASCDQGLLLDLMQLGVRELWFEPLKIEQMQLAINRLVKLKTAATSAAVPASTVLAFLPARGGCGTTTVAVNTAAAIQRLQHPSVLLADFDFHNSVIAFWLKLDPRHGFQEALERSQWLDPALWKSIVHPVQGLDILTSSQAATPGVFSGGETTALLDFTCQNYEYIIVDLPEAIYTYCWEVLDRAKYVMIVVTPEMASLYLARRKASQLIDHGIARDRLRIVLNRSSQLDVQAAEVEKFLSIPVIATFQNQYRVVTSAFADGKFVPENSKLGERFAELAALLSGVPTEAKEKTSPGRKWRQIFSPA
jgi:pilus assembly protein CpaE